MTAEYVGCTPERHSSIRDDPIAIDLQYNTVEGKFLKRDGQWLTFSAEVRDQKGTLLARGKSFHWIIDESEEQ